MFSDFPSLHPLIVHFPIVLILISVAFQAAVVWRNWEQIRWATMFIMGGAFFAALAASTVFHAMPSDNTPKEAMEIFANHEIFAEYTLWISGVTFLLRCIGEFFKIFRRSFEVIVLVSAVASAIFLSIAGHHGARLTHVAGVGPMGRYLMKDHHGSGDMKDMQHSDDMEGDSTMKMNDAMPSMKEIPGMDTMKNMNDMKSMPGMDKKDGMKMKDMGKMEKKMKGMEKQEMQDMPGMEDMKTKNDKKRMEDIPGMKTKNDMKGMDMNNMDSTMKMDMPGMEMPGMNMKSNAMDTFKFEDNNPAFQKSKKKSKQ